MSKGKYGTKLEATGTVIPMDWEKRAISYLELLKEMEWVMPRGKRRIMKSKFCPTCRRTHAEGHADNCRLADKLDNK